MLRRRRRLLLSAAIGLAGLLLATPALATTAEHIVIQVSPGVHTGAAYNVSIMGRSQQRARAYLFVDYSGCARSFAVERQRNPGGWDSYRVQGSFSKLSGWRSSAPGTDHACAYLVSASGHVLATARRAYQVG